ncbi:MAG: protein translocase subunit SecD [Bacilli bacterium]|nr:protein translocase subunit SecD [Bacilli bacterium]
MKKNKKNIITPLLILGIILIIILLLFKPIFKGLNYGLDLKGGFEVLYQVKPLEKDDKIDHDSVLNTYKTMQRRIDVLGVSEPNIIIEGKDKIRVQLAGVTNPEEARKILSQTANLTFRDTNDNLLMTSDVLKSGGAKLASDESGLPAVSLSIHDKEEFFKVTNMIKDYQNNMIVIWLDFDENEDSYQKEASNCGALSDSKCLSAARVEQGFASDVIIKGNFTRAEAESLVELINSGSMPTKLVEISSQTVSALFGEPTLKATLIAGIIGVTLIILFMIVIYKFVGIIAGFSILIYSFVVFAIFYLIGGVLTLPGIAAMVLGIGMAVDASVITFERIKEELFKGRSLKGAFTNGNEMSFRAILDANITTLIVAVILFILGESTVKGFATMLIINIIITMLIMVYLNRKILKIFIETNFFNDKTRKFIGIKEVDIPNIEKKEVVIKKQFEKLNFMKDRNKFFIISSSIIIIGIIVTSLFGLNLGVDYRGGSRITFLGDKVTEEIINREFKEFDYKVIDINKFKDGTSVLISNELNNDEVHTLDKHFNDKYDTPTEIDVVSNVVKKELTKNAIYALIYAMLGIVIYMTVRHKFTFAVAVILALIHDVLITVTIISIFRLEVSTMFIAAILTIIGYSINDTIVIFDRIKENIKEMYNGVIKTKDELTNLINESLRQTFLRTLYTTITTLLPVIALIIFGSSSINTFNISLLVGLIVGTYSSVFLASQIWFLLEQKNVGKDISKRKKIIDIKLDDELDELEVKGINK